MKYLFTKSFKAQLKKLKKKYPSVKEDLLAKFDDLDLANEISIGKSIYKVRIASSDQNRGASAGFRSYLFLYSVKDLLVPLCIYHKSEREGVSENELKYYLDISIREVLALFL